MTTIRLAPHVHSAASDDSTWRLPRLVRVLKLAGYGGALVCDHDRTMTDVRWQNLQQECARGSAATGFALVPGIEYQDRDHVVHMPVFGAVPFYGRSPDIGELVATAHNDGAATVFAHPGRRSAFERFDREWVPYLSGIEVWNRKYDGVHPNTWALKTAAREGVTPFVSLDWHGPRQLYPLSMRVNLDAHETDAHDQSSRIVAAIRRGDVRAHAFGLSPHRYESGALGALSTRIEMVRQWAAPRVRTIERLAGRMP